MPLLHEGSNEELYAWVRDRNLEQQYFLLETTVGMYLRLPNPRFTPDVVFALHSAASNFIIERAGEIRFDGVGISGSKHEPTQAPEEVRVQFHDFLSELNELYPKKSDIWLAAYCYWKLNWIHPFSDGNGRTSRALACLVMCTKKGFWMPGSRSMLEQLRENNRTCHELLNAVHYQFNSTGEIDLTNLENLWFNASYNQMIS